jgi:hypothetical protein
MLGLVEDALVFLGILILHDWKGHLIKLSSGRYGYFQLNAKTMTRLSRDSLDTLYREESISSSETMAESRC